DLLGGSIDVAISTLATVTPFLKSDRIKIIALADPQRYKTMPHTPVLAETYPTLTAPAWFAFVAPAGTPPAIVKRIHEAAVEALNTEAVRKGLETGGLIAVGQGPEELRAFIKK